jgi:hypothetical protein
MSHRITKFTRKLTDEAAHLALRGMAAGKQGQEVVDLIKEKFGIDISTARINGLKSQPKWIEFFKAYRNDYVKQYGLMSDNKEFFIAEKRNRIEIIQQLLEKCLDDTAFSNKKDQITTALKVLQEAREETKEITNPSDKKPLSLLDFAAQTVNVQQNIKITPMGNGAAVPPRPIENVQNAEDVDGK